MHIFVHFSAFRVNAYNNPEPITFEIPWKHCRAVVSMTVKSSNLNPFINKMELLCDFTILWSTVYMSCSYLNSTLLQLCNKCNVSACLENRHGPQSVHLPEGLNEK